MRSLVLVLVVLVSPLILLRAQSPAAGGRDVVDLAVEAGSFKTLVAAVQAAGLEETLRGPGPFTVFAPTDAAFAKLPAGTVESLLEPGNRDRLRRILTHHVVAGKRFAGEAVGSLESVAGYPLEVTIVDGSLNVGSARVLKNDLEVENGVVHVIDSVLLPPEPVSIDPKEAMRRLLVLAIERGAPLYNEGQPAACAAIYEVAVQALAERPGSLDDALVSDLRKALETTRKSQSPIDNAWTLRRAMDRCLTSLLEEKGEDMEAVNSSPTSAVFDFEPGSPLWFSVNDDVMGGISRSGFQLTGEGTAVFAGALSLENNGGFATVRAPARDLQLAGSEGVMLRVRGDGRTYGLSAMRSDRRNEVSIWQTRFETKPGVWQEIRIPFASLELSVMGRRFKETGPLPAAEIRSMAFSIADKNETPFRLEVDWIRAYGGDVTF